jgi:hypothetical protein
VFLVIITSNATSSTSVSVIRQTPAAVNCNAQSSVTINGTKKWEPEPVTPETWTAASDTSETWTPAEVIAETWTPQSTTNETWTPISDTEEIWQQAA